MRMIVTLDPDVAAAVEQLRGKRSVGVSAALNELARAGIPRRPECKPFIQRTSSMGALIDVTNVAEALELVDGPDAC